MKIERNAREGVASDPDLQFIHAGKRARDLEGILHHAPRAAKARHQIEIWEMKIGENL